MSEPTAPEPQPDASGGQPQVTPATPVADDATPATGTPQVAPAHAPHQPTSGAYPVPQQQHWAQPGPAPQSAPPGGLGLGLLGLLLGLVSAVVSLLPIDESGIRQYTPFPFAIGGIVLSLLCLNARGRGAAMAGVGLVLSGLGLVLGLILVTNYSLHYIP